MSTKYQDTDLETEEKALEKATALYEIVCFQSRLKAIDRLTWDDYFITVGRILLPIAFAAYVLGTPSLNTPLNAWFGSFMLVVAGYGAFETYRKRAQKREAVLVQCLQALISEASSRGAFLGGARLEIE